MLVAEAKSPKSSSASCGGSLDVDLLEPLKDPQLNAECDFDGVVADEFLRPEEPTSVANGSFPAEGFHLFIP